MGIYLNPGSGGFLESISSEIYVDKTGLIVHTNERLGTEQRFLCVSRPRRFGKSMAAKMLAAYYGKGESGDLFSGLEIREHPSFYTHLNQYNVIFLNMQKFWGRTHDIRKMLEFLKKAVLREVWKAYPDVDFLDKEDLLSVLEDVYNESGVKYVFIIDEWDCIFREAQTDKAAQKVYLDFLRNMLKDSEYVALAYMTGILPIKKYGTHSALNMFDEYSMIAPGILMDYVGFTEAEVQVLCERYNMDFEETKAWYDGYCFGNGVHIYSPKSVVSAMLNQAYHTYWNQTETFEALRDYIVMNQAGLKDTVIELLAGERKKIETGTFSNDMTTFSDADDVLTLLVHLGYLAYDCSMNKVYIPNSEVAAEFVNAIKGAGWDEVVRAVRESEDLLKATWRKDEEAVAAGIENTHFETPILMYNDENSLSCTVSLAYYSARRYYILIREFPSGKGFADIIFLPRRNHLDKPAMIVELKWDKSADGAIRQIEEKKYAKALEGYVGTILLVAINYDKKRKTHECSIKEIWMQCGETMQS